MLFTEAVIRTNVGDEVEVEYRGALEGEEELRER